MAAPGLSFAAVGAEVDVNGVSYRVWAPDHQAVRVVTGPAGGETRYVALERDAEGFFSGHDPAGRPGDLYWYQLGERLVADPASRFQPTGVEGPSQVVDPRGYAWTETEWRRPPLRGRVI
jgi:maltooligosyltrehalose trehalohydrolase